MKLNWINKKWLIAFHAICWVILFSLPFLLRSYSRAEHHSHQPDDEVLLYFYFLSSGLWIILFYVHAHVFLRFGFSAPLVPLVAGANACLSRIL
jgi:hypothetical protein